MFFFYITHAALPLRQICLPLYLPLFSFFFFFLFEWCFSPSYLNFSFFFFFRGDFSFIFLFALYIDEIGFFCSPMEDNHCGNCHLIAMFHSTVKGRNTGERALKPVMAYISLPRSLCLSLAIFISSLPPVSRLFPSPPQSLTLSGGSSLNIKYCCVNN